MSGAEGELPDYDDVVSSGDAPFESIADFFTLLSSAMIVAAVLFGVFKYTPASYESVSPLVITADGPPGLPAGVLVLAVSRDKLGEVLWIATQDQQEEVRLSEKSLSTSVEAALNDRFKLVYWSSAVIVVEDSRDGKRRPESLRHVHTWLSENSRGFSTTFRK